MMSDTPKAIAIPNRFAVPRDIIPNLSWLLAELGTQPRFKG